MQYKVAIETFGCRLNQAESSVFARQFTARGYRWVGCVDEADLCIINTCTLTAQATAKCRRLVRSIIRRNPDACIAAVGCYAQTGADVLRTIPGLDYIIGTTDKMRLPAIIRSPAKLPEPVVVRGRAARGRFTIDSPGLFPAHTRANIKVQEGCNFVCSFCIIPKSRGPARSRAFDDIIREATTLTEEGHRELVLTGINVGTYQDRGKTLADVMDALAVVDGLERVRLSSIEPTTIEQRLIDRMAAEETLCPYLHIPLQSGDDGILETMRRKYTCSDYREFADGVLERVPRLGLGTDVIVGFPGEDDEAFASTRDLIEALPFNNVHVFSFSAREGTGAYRMKNQVPGRVIAERSRIMHRLANRKKLTFYKGQIGKELTVLFEQRDRVGRFVGFSDNYVKVAVTTGEDLSNRFGVVRVVGVIDHRAESPVLAVGELVHVENRTRTVLAHALHK